MNKNYDVVIIGTGPAGCITANFLNKEFKILLIEKSDLPRDKPCGGILVDESKNFLKNIVKKDLPDDVFSYPKLIGLENIDWNNNKSKKFERDFWNISRAKFDNWLLEIVEGVETISNTTFEGFSYNKDDSITLKIKNSSGELEKINTLYLIGADGANSLIRKKLLTDSGKKLSTNFYVAKQIWIEPKNEIDNNYTKFIYDNTITDFYSWVVPKGKYTLLGSALKPILANKNFDLFLNKLKEKENIYGNIIKNEAALIFRPETEKDVFLGTEKILLVGEAAGLISPSTAEGTSFAMRSGLKCAQIINNNFCNNLIENYNKVCQYLIDEIREKLFKSKMISNPNSRSNFFDEDK